MTKPAKFLCQARSLSIDLILTPCMTTAKSPAQQKHLDTECYNLELLNVIFFFSLHIISKEFIRLTVVSHFCFHKFLSIFFSQINLTEILQRLTVWANCNLLFKWRKYITYSAVFSYIYFIEGTNSVATTPSREVISAIMKKLYPWLVKL